MIRWIKYRKITINQLEIITFILAYLLKVPWFLFLRFYRRRCRLFRRPFEAIIVFLRFFLWLFTAFLYNVLCLNRDCKLFRNRIDVWGSRSIFLLWNKSLIGNNVTMHYIMFFLLLLFWIFQAIKGNIFLLIYNFRLKRTLLPCFWDRVRLRNCICL